MRHPTASICPLRPQFRLAGSDNRLRVPHLLSLIRSQYPIELTFILACARRLPPLPRQPIRLGVNAVCRTGRLARVSLPLSGWKTSPDCGGGRSSDSSCGNIVDICPKRACGSWRLTLLKISLQTNHFCGGRFLSSSPSILDFFLGYCANLERA
jgi:hypothetical protein